MKYSKEQTKELLLKIENSLREYLLKHNINDPILIGIHTGGVWIADWLQKSMGFKGRFAIHPDQIKPIHEAFNPSKEELIWAKGVLEEAKTAGTGAFKFQGKMVDAPVLTVARLIISRES